MCALDSQLKFIPEWYKQLVENGNEKVRLADFIKEKFLQERVDDLLEIGMGTRPIFSTILSDCVNKYVILEKENTPDILLPSNVKIINTDFEEKVFNGKFDLIILSHVVYYFLDLEKAIEKAIRLLKQNGKAIFVVNGTENNYGKLKKAFAEIADITFTFTYDLLLKKLRNFLYEEYTLETHIDFDSSEELYKQAKLFFSLFPEEYLQNREKIINWLKENVKGQRFYMDQKIITVRGYL